MKSNIDLCPICNNRGIIHYTNRIDSRICLLTIGKQVKYINRICNDCLSEVDDDFAKGILPELCGN